MDLISFDDGYLVQNQIIEMKQLGTKPVQLQVTMKKGTGAIQAHWQFAVLKQYSVHVRPIPDMVFEQPFLIELDIEGAEGPVRLKYKVEGDVAEMGEVTVNS